MVVRFTLFNFKSILIPLSMFLILSFLMIGCSLEKVTDSANDIKNQVAEVSDQAADKVKEVQNTVEEISNSEVKKELEKSLQTSIDTLKTRKDTVVKPNGELNWDELRKTQVAQHVFFSAFGHDFKAVIKGDGTVEVMKHNTNTGEKKVYATYKVLFENGNVKLQ